MKVFYIRKKKIKFAVKFSMMSTSVYGFISQIWHRCDAFGTAIKHTCSKMKLTINPTDPEGRAVLRLRSLPVGSAPCHLTYSCPNRLQSPCLSRYVTSCGPTIWRQTPNRCENSPTVAPELALHHPWRCMTSPAAHEFQHKEQDFAGRHWLRTVL